MRRFVLIHFAKVVAGDTIYRSMCVCSFAIRIVGASLSHSVVSIPILYLMSPRSRSSLARLLEVARFYFNDCSTLHSLLFNLSQRDICARACKLIIRNSVLEVLFIPCLILRSSPIFSGKPNWTRGFHRPSKTRFLRFPLPPIW